MFWYIYIYIYIYMITACIAVLSVDSFRLHSKKPPLSFRLFPKTQYSSHLVLLLYVLDVEEDYTDNLALLANTPAKA